MHVLEFGSGNSTLWWSHRSKQLTSIETDPEWFSLVKEKLPAGVDYRLTDSADGAAGYPQACAQIHGSFDLIIIDGLNRPACMINALPKLRPNGVVLWDNSDRLEDAEGYQFLISNGFSRIDFFGAGPINAYPWATSIFYRSNNCLNI